MIPILYDSGESAFVSNGLCRLRDIISCTVTEERNGIYECDFEYPVTGANYDLIKCGRIIAVTHDETGDIQPFDIVSYSRPVDGVVSFHAVHISYRQRKLTASGTNINSLADALDLMKTSEPNNPFNYWTDMDSSAPFGAADGVPHTVRQMLGGMEGSILDTYGGEYEWDKWTVKLWGARGTESNFTIRYGVNLMGYDEDVDYSSTYTACIPFWKGNNNGADAIVIGNKVNADATPYDGREACIPLDLSDKFQELPTRQDLEDAAAFLMRTNQVFNPAQTIKVNFIRLQDTSDYAQYESLLKCKLCDTISVVFPMYDMTGSFKIVKTVYNALEERFDEMELGALSMSLSEALGINTSDSSYHGSGGGGGVIGSKIFYGTCSTGSSTAEKVVACPSFTANDLKAGTIIYVDFTNANGASNPKLNVNSTTAVSIMRYGSTTPSTSAATSWNAGSVVCLVHDGTYWNIAGWLNTTYSAISQSNIENLSGTSTGLITGQRLTQGVAKRVKFTQVVSTGTKIGTIEINGTATDIYTGGGGISDVQVNGTSVVTNNVANVPVARSDRYGVIKGYYDTDPGGGVIGITIHNSSEQELTGYAPMSVYVPGSGYQPIMAKFLPDATQSVKGAMSASDKTKLDGIASGAEVNVQSNWTEADSSSDAFILNKPALATVATSGSYNDLSNKPTIPTVNDATLTIKKNGTTVNTFTANASSNVTADISVPTVTSDLVNDSGFVTSADLPKEYDFTSSLTPSIDARGVTAKAYTVTPADTSQLTVENCRKVSAYLISSGGGGTEVKPLIVTDFTVSSSILRIYVKSIYGSTQSTTSISVSGTLHVVAPFAISNVTAYTPM